MHHSSSTLAPILLAAALFSSPVMAFPPLLPWWDVSGAEAIVHTLDVNGDSVADLEFRNYHTWSGNAARFAVEHRHSITLQTLGSTAVLLGRPAEQGLRVLPMGGLISIQPTDTEQWLSGQFPLGTVVGYTTADVNGLMGDISDDSRWENAAANLGVRIEGPSGVQVGWAQPSRHLSEMFLQRATSPIAAGAAAPGNDAVAGVSRHVLSRLSSEVADVDGDGAADLILERRWSGTATGLPAAIFLIPKANCEILGNSTSTSLPDWNLVPGEPPRNGQGEVMTTGWISGLPHRHWVRVYPGASQSWLPADTAAFLRFTSNGTALGATASGINTYVGVKLKSANRTRIGWLEFTPAGEIVRKLAVSGELTFAGDRVPLESDPVLKDFTIQLWDFNEDGLVDLQAIQPGKGLPPPMSDPWNPATWWRGPLWRLLEPGLALVIPYGEKAVLPPSVGSGTKIEPCFMPKPDEGLDFNPPEHTVFAQGGHLPLRVQKADGCHAGWISPEAVFVSPQPNRAVMAGYQDDDTESPLLSLKAVGNRVEFSWPPHLLGFELQAMSLTNSKAKWGRLQGSVVGSGTTFQPTSASMPRNNPLLSGAWLFRIYRPKLGSP